jgi:hypothetical protein
MKGNSEYWARQESLPEILLYNFEAYGHEIKEHSQHSKGRFTHSMPFPCRAHAAPLPCRAAKGLECVFPIWFTQCGLVWFTFAMPRPCHPRPYHSSQGHGTAWPSRGGLWANCPRSASSGYHTEFREVVIRRIPISDACGQCENKHFIMVEEKSGRSTLQKRRSVTLLN